MKASVNGIDIYYELHGKEGEPWLVLSHSLACSLRMWDPQIDAFKASHRILAYDMRGHGQTSAPAGPYTFDMLADDVLGLAASLKITYAAYCGLSIGGMIGQTIAIRGRGPFERMVLADTTHTQPPDALKQWEERIRIAETKGMAGLVDSTLERWFTPAFRSSPAVKKIAEQIVRTPVAGYVGCGRAIMALNTTAKLPGINIPVLAITGEQDAAAPGTRYIAEHVPGTRLVVIPQASHIANIEQPEAFSRALREFLSSPPSARA